MKTGYRNLLAAATLATAMNAAPATQAAEPPMPTATVTVYVGMPLGKKAGAKDVNAMHAKMEKDGWRFADLESNNENGDTEGVWLTYTRP
ncbi:MAG: hypothetical protein ACRER4_00305 [Steroidobacteraceae bacterium]